MKKNKTVYSDADFTRKYIDVRMPKLLVFESKCIFREETDNSEQSHLQYHLLPDGSFVSFIMEDQSVELIVVLGAVLDCVKDLERAQLPYGEYRRALGCLHDASPTFDLEKYTYMSLEEYGELVGDSCLTKK